MLTRDQSFGVIPKTEKKWSCPNSPLDLAGASGQPQHQRQCQRRRSQGAFLLLYRQFPFFLLAVGFLDTFFFLTCNIINHGSGVTRLGSGVRPTFD